MAYLFEVPIDGAPPMLVEVSEDDDGIVRAARSGGVVGQAAESLSAALERVWATARVFAAQIEQSSECPDEIGVQFGFKLTAEAGFVVAKATSEANFQVSFTWRKS